MNTSSTNSAEISTAQNGSNISAMANIVETETSSNDITEMSPKQLQAITFLSKTEAALENCLKQEQISDCTELQNVVKNLAIVLKNGEKETQQFVEETLNKDDNKVLFLLQKAAFSLFKGMSMCSVCMHTYNAMA